MIKQNKNTLLFLLLIGIFSSCSNKYISYQNDNVQIILNEKKQKYYLKFRYGRYLVDTYNSIGKYKKENNTIVFYNKFNNHVSNEEIFGIKYENDTSIVKGVYKICCFDTISYRYQDGRIPAGYYLFLKSEKPYYDFRLYPNSGCEMYNLLFMSDVKFIKDSTNNREITLKEGYNSIIFHYQLPIFPGADKDLNIAYHFYDTIKINLISEVEIKIESIDNKKYYDYISNRKLNINDTTSPINPILKRAENELNDFYVK